MVRCGLGRLVEVKRLSQRGIFRLGRPFGLAQLPLHHGPFGIREAPRPPGAPDSLLDTGTDGLGQGVRARQATELVGFMVGEPHTNVDITGVCGPWTACRAMGHALFLLRDTLSVLGEFLLNKNIIVVEQESRL
jgi:hypothetical protein